MRIPCVRTVRRLLAVAVLIPVLGGCDNDTTEPEPLPVPALITVTGNGQTAAAGTTLQAPLSVKVTTSAGVPIAGQAIRATVTAGGGTISPVSGVTGADGTASATWTVGTTTGQEQKVRFEAVSATGAALLQAEATATVVAGAAATVQITPSTLPRFMSSGRTAQLTAVARDAFGNPVTAAITWTSADTAVATVSSTGLVRTGLKTGTAVIVARTGAAAGTVIVEQDRLPANVVVTRPANVRSLRVGESMQFSAAATDSAGQPVDAGVTWVSVTPARATVDQSGRLTAVSGGWAVVEARVTAGAGRDSVFVGPDASIVLTLLSPADTVVTADSMEIRVRVQSTRAVQGVQATFAGVTRTLTAGANNEWSARVSTTALATGANTLVIDARADQGFHNTLSRTITLDRPVTLTITSPAANATYVTVVPVNATCSSGGVPCTSLTAVASFGPTLTGTSSVSGNMVGTSGQHTIRFTGRSASGRVSVVDVPVTVTIPAQPITSWTIESGANQTALAGNQLSSDIVVRAIGTGGVPVPNMPVTVTTNHGTVQAAATTDINGRLSIRWRLGNTAGQQKLTVSAIGVTGPVTTDVFALALAGAASSVAILSGSGQTVAQNELVPEPLRAVVRDAVGNTVSNATVTWSVQSGGGSITATSQTDDAGVATAQWRVGLVGPQSARATIFNGASVTFTATAGPAAMPTRLDIPADSMRFYTRSRVQNVSGTVRDQYGNPMAGTITWSTTNPSIVTVAPDGSAQAQATDGVAYIVGASGALRDSVRVRVSRYPSLFELRPTFNNTQVMPVGDSVRIIVDVVADSAGFPLTNPVITFVSQHPAVAMPSSGGWIRGLSDGETVIEIGVAGTTALLTRTIRVGPDPAVDITVGTECVRGGIVMRCFTVNPATELVPVTVNYPPASVASILVRIGGVEATSTSSPVQVPTSALGAGEHPMYVRVTTTNGRYNEVRGVAIITP